MRVFCLLLLTLSAVVETEAFLFGIFDRIWETATKIFGKVFDWTITSFNKFVDTGFTIGNTAIGVMVDPFGWWKPSIDDHGHATSNVAKCPARADILFVLDTSGSMSEKEFDLEKNFAIRLSEHFQIGDGDVRFAAITFSDRVQRVFNFNTHTNQNGLTLGLTFTPFLGGGTKTYLALDYIIQQNLFSESNGGREKATKVVVVLTDGSSDSLLKTKAASDRLKERYHVVAVGIGSGFGLELQSIASGFKNVFTADSFASLVRIEQRVARRLCEIPEADGNIPPTGDGSGTCATGFQKNPNRKGSCVDINECKTRNSCQQTCINTVGSYRCSCKAGFVIDPKDTGKCLSLRTCTSQVDVLLVIDASGSIGTENFKTQQTFVAKLTHHFTVGPKGTLFGGLLFSTGVKKLFDLKTYTSRTDITTSLLGAPYIEGGTNTHLALRYVLDNKMFSPDNGGRSNAPDVVVLVTDGSASNEPAAVAAAGALNALGVDVLAVGIGDQVELPQLLKLANNNGKNVFVTAEFDLLDYLEQSVADAICSAT